VAGPGRRGRIAQPGPGGRVAEILAPGGGGLAPGRAVRRLLVLARVVLGELVVLELVIFQLVVVVGQLALVLRVGQLVKVLLVALSAAAAVVARVIAAVSVGTPRTLLTDNSFRPERPGARAGQ